MEEMLITLASPDAATAAFSAGSAGAHQFKGGGHGGGIGGGEIVRRRGRRSGLPCIKPILLTSMSSRSGRRKSRELPSTSWASKAAASTEKPWPARPACKSVQRRSVAAIDDDMGPRLRQRPRHGRDPDGRGCPKQRRFCRPDGKSFCSIAAARRPTSKLPVHGKQVFTACRPPTPELVAAQHCVPTALLETALRHSKVANPLTIGHPTGASSPADRPHHKGTTFMTSKYLFAALTAGLLLGAAPIADAADAPAAPPITAAVPRRWARPRPRTTRRTIRQPWPRLMPPRKSTAARPMTI